MEDFFLQTGEEDCASDAWEKLCQRGPSGRLGDVPEVGVRMATSMREDVCIPSDVLPKMMAVDVSVEKPVEETSARLGITTAGLTIAEKEPR